MIVINYDTMTEGVDEDHDDTKFACVMRLARQDICISATPERPYSIICSPAIKAENSLSVSRTQM